jgi:hypothetical protein|nr:hypothetical protein OlV1_gene90 [Ostreococcus lucimarinus virus 1]
MYAYLMGRQVEPLAAREPTPEPEPEPEPEKKGKLGYILVGVMGLILSKLKT